MGVLSNYSTSFVVVHEICVTSFMRTVKNVSFMLCLVKILKYFEINVQIIEVFSTQHMKFRALYKLS